MASCVDPVDVPISPATRRLAIWHTAKCVPRLATALMVCPKFGSAVP